MSEMIWFKIRYFHDSQNEPNEGIDPAFTLIITTCLCSIIFSYIFSFANNNTLVIIELISNYRVCSVYTAKIHIIRSSAGTTVLQITQTD